MVELESHGDFSKTENFLKNLKEVFVISLLDKHGQRGVEALRNATPKDTGLTANSWYYEVNKRNGGIELSFNNSNINNGVRIALILQFGHATKNGGWVAGRDYITPALKPVFDSILSDAMEEIRKL